MRKRHSRPVRNAARFSLVGLAEPIVDHAVRHGEQRRIIADAVAAAWNVRPEDIYSTRRHKSVALPRHVAMYLSRELTSLSWKEIGRHFGRHNHTGALYATKKIKSALLSDPVLADRIKRLRSQLEG